MTTAAPPIHDSAFASATGTVPGSALVGVPPGLKGVVATDTTVGDVRGAEGFFHYRQYCAVELAERRSLEDVWHLLLEGHLPTRSEHAAFVRSVARMRDIPDNVASVLPAIAGATSTAPLDAFRTALSLLAGHLELQPLIDIDPEQRRRDAQRLCAVTPTLMAALFRRQRGLEPIDPRPDLAWAENYLWMLNGVEPQRQRARALERYLVLTVDHGMNASTFAARVIASTGADLGAAIIGAAGALSGPLHGGAPSRALDLLDAIGPLPGTGPLTAAGRARVDTVVRGKLDRGEKLMGFGHAVYIGEDPRASMLREVARDLGGPLFEQAERIEPRIIELLDEYRPGRKLGTNVEYWAGVVMSSCGVAPEMFTPTFASSRIIGWCANAVEQAAQDKIIRPSARYVGPPPPQPVPAAPTSGRDSRRANGMG